MKTEQATVFMSLPDKMSTTVYSRGWKEREGGNFGTFCCFVASSKQFSSIKAV